MMEVPGSPRSIVRILTRRLRVILERVEALAQSHAQAYAAAVASHALSSNPLKPTYETMSRKDITLAKSVLGWAPTIQLREGLQKTIDYFKALT